jgi:hypothetical protein
VVHSESAQQLLLELSRAYQMRDFYRGNFVFISVLFRFNAVVVKSGRSTALAVGYDRKLVPYTTEYPKVSGLSR